MELVFTATAGIQGKARAHDHNESLNDVLDSRCRALLTGERETGYFKNIDMKGQFGICLWRRFKTKIFIFRVL
jgi:hypothetical protein